MTAAAPRRIGVVGGGTAGYLGALALRRHHPGVELTLIESSRVPVIGVGEGTTPVMVPFLHGYLGLDIGELFEQVRPTWKLGVRLEWGPGETEHFNFPFDAAHVVESHCHTGDVNSGSFGSHLMERRAGIHLLQADWRCRSVADRLPFAYHLDNRRFVAYLKRQADAAGVRYVDALIVAAERAPDGGVARVLADDGRRFEFDLYVDCSGFRSLLLGGALEEPAVNYADSLLTDSALVAEHPHRAPLAPYTTATTMRAGWCWSVPQEHSDHRGYVYASAFIDEDEAAVEMARVCPGMSSPRRVGFRPHRRRAWWRHNVVGIGNAYGFVEPLQATALHMIVRQVTCLVACLERAAGDAAMRARLNDTVATTWDNVAGLLALHYRFNRRGAGPFWQAAREQTRLGAVEAMVSTALAHGPRAEPEDDAHDGVLLGGLRAEVDLLLLGMKAFAPHTVRTPAEPERWRRHLHSHRRLAARAIPARDSLAAARRRAPPHADGGAWYEGILSGLQRPVY